MILGDSGMRSLLYWYERAKEIDKEMKKAAPKTEKK